MLHSSIIAWYLARSFCTSFVDNNGLLIFRNLTQIMDGLLVLALCLIPKTKISSTSASIGETAGHIFF